MKSVSGQWELADFIRKRFLAQLQGMAQNHGQGHSSRYQILPPLPRQRSPHGTPCRGLLIDFTLLPELSKTELLKLRLWETAPGTSGKDFQSPSSPHQEMNPLVKKSGSDHISPSHRYYSSSLTMLDIMALKEIRCPFFSLQAKAGYTCGVRCNISIWAESPACGGACLTHLTCC